MNPWESSGMDYSFAYEIRKISVGADYKTAMHYILGQSVLNDSHKISGFTCDSSGRHFVWIINEKQEVLLWKSFGNSMPISIEYNINI